jgi:hypothetical protein
MAAASPVLLLVYVCVKAVACRNELKNRGLPEYYQNDDRIYTQHWRQLTLSACVMLFAVILYIGSDFAMHSQVLH